MLRTVKEAGVPNSGSHWIDLQKALLESEDLVVAKKGKYYVVEDFKQKRVRALGD